MQPDLVLPAPAKINWFLEVLRRRDDGYHELETVMSPLAWADELHFFRRSDDRFELRVQAAPALLDSLPPAQENLVIRSLRRMQAEAGTRGSFSHGLDVLLKKRLPTQAGLGGGSSDAASAILAANHLWRLDLDPKRLEEIAGELGSDVPFFVRGQAASCSGRGEYVRPLSGPTGVPCLVICPPFGLPTGSVFSRVELSSPRYSCEDFVNVFQSRNLTRLTRMMQNRLQSAAEAINQRIALICHTVKRTEPLVVQMTGSGSCLFALYRTTTVARRARARIGSQLRDCCLVLTHTVAGQVAFGQASSLGAMSRREILGNNRSESQADERSG